MSDPRPDDPPPPARILVGELAIARWLPGDLDELQLAVLESIDSLRPWMAWANDDTAAQSGFLAAASRGWEQGERFEYAVRHVRDGLLGSVGLMRRIGPGGLEIGYWVHAAHTGRGVAKLAAAALTQAAFGLMWVDHVEIHHDRANLASRGVPAGLGFELIESLEKTPMAPSETGTDLVWRLDRDDFPASAARSLLGRAPA